MSNLLKKIKRRIKMTADAYSADLVFSRKLANYRLMDDLCWKLRIKKVSAFYHEKKDEWILNYLKDKLHNVLEKYESDLYIGEKLCNAPIWVCWWSGEDAAPDLVKQCIKSIRKNAGNHPIYIITEKNHREYLDIPAYILEKVTSGAMCIANFSDYLRVALLEKYGGLWLDATIFCAQPIPEQYFETSFFTCKSLEMESRYISKVRWTSFCLGGWKKHVFYRFFKEALECYWESEKSSIDYLLVDYIIETAYRYIPIVKECIDAVEPNNLRRDDLQTAMNRALPEECWNDIIQEKTILYKLSWRETYSQVAENGSKSIYEYYLNMDI